MAGVSTDTVGLRVKPGSFVVKRGSSILNEKLLDKILGKKPKGYAGGGTVPITATPEERIAPPEVVDMYGIDFFRAINNSSDNATHPERMDALIAQSELAGMKPMYDGGEVAPGYENGGNVPRNVPKSILNIPFSLLANILNKPVPRTSTVLSPEEQILMELESGAHFPKTDVPSPEEEILSELINVAKQKEKDRPISSPFKGYQEGEEVGEYPEPGKAGRYKDPIHRYLSDMILAGKADEMGQLLNDDYYKPLVEKELKFMQLQNLVQSAEEALPTYTGKKEGIDIGDIFGEQSWLKRRGQKKSIRNIEDILGETLYGQRRNEIFEKGWYGFGSEDMPEYQMGGSTYQQSPSYQLNGLLKYKRNPIVG